MIARDLTLVDMVILLMIWEAYTVYSFLKNKRIKKSIAGFIFFLLYTSLYIAIISQ